MASTKTSANGAASAASVAPPTARAKLKEWVRKQIDGLNEIDMPAVADAGVKELGADAAFMRALYADSLRKLIYDAVQTVCAQTRRDMIMLGDKLVDRASVARRGDALRSKWALWLEQVDGKQVRLWSMTKGQLLAAAMMREKRAEVEIETARLWRLLASEMETDDETVGQRFTLEEIEAFHAKINPAAAAAAATEAPTTGAGAD